MVIDNITLEETAPQEEIPPEPDTEMIQNGDFAAGEEHWESFVGEGGEAEISFAEEKAVYQITKVGNEDWSVQLKHKELLTLEKEAVYQVKMKLKSTESRTVKYSFLDPSYKWYGGEDLALTANEVKEVVYELKVTEDTSSKITFSISMGKIAGEETPASTIEIDDISVIKLSGGTDTPEKPEEPDEPVAIGTELIKNGDFADGETNWIKAVTAPGAAEVSFAEQKAVYQITSVGTLDHHVQLKQSGLKLEQGANYKVNMKLKSTESRTVKVALLDPVNNYAYYGGMDIELNAGRQKSISQIITVEKDTVDTIDFLISMGKIENMETPVSTIEIDDISIIKVESGTQPDEETEEPAPDRPENPDEPVAVGTELIKNGDFADGETNWIKAVTAPGAAEVSFAEQKAVYQITSVGTLDHHVQLKQSGLKLEQGANYKVNMKLKSTESRTVKVALLDPVNNYAYYGGMDIELNAGRQKSISQIITVEKDTVDTIDFLISMGKIENMETPVSTIEIDDISIIKVESGTQPDEETEEPAPEADGNTSNPETTEGQNIQPEAEESDEKSEPSASQTDEPQSESDEDEEETATAQTTEEENDETNTESVENDSSANQKNS